MFLNAIWKINSLPDNINSIFLKKTFLKKRGGQFSLNSFMVLQISFMSGLIEDSWGL